MSDRRWENVWAEIVAKARAHLASGEPVNTLDRDVPNNIVNVTATSIRRRSANPRSDVGESIVRSADVQELWEKLVRDGGVELGGRLAFSYALVGRLIEGVNFTTSPVALTFSDRKRAMTPWSGEGAQHLLLKWSPKVRPDTIQVHETLASQHGSVWWGLIGTTGPTEKRFQEYSLQLAGAASTYAYLYETGQPVVRARCWRAKVLAFTRDAAQVPDDHMPTYYSKSQCHSYVELADGFEELPAGWAAEHLALASDERTPVAPTALQNQTTPMYVTHHVSSQADVSHTWWVMQGATYAAHRSGGFVWAPVKAKSGNSIGYHTNVSKLRPGHVIVHYANGAIRALGRVSGMPDIRANPSDVASDQWGDEGHYAPVEYFELSTPIVLTEIINRDPAVGPFAADGGVKQGYLFPLAAGYAQELRTLFADRWPPDSPWGDAEPRRQWLFQANPKLWDLAHALQSWKVGEEDTWTTSRYRERMNPGDLVALWTGGPQAGVLALAELTGKPYEVARPSWRGPGAGEDLEKPDWTVPLRLTRVLDRPLMKEPLTAHPVLANLGVLRFAQATNYEVSREQWDALLALIEEGSDPGIGVTGTLASLSASLLLEPVTFLDDVEQLLADKRQVIFYGPPGTGKTFIARQLATFLARSREGVEVVQLHPSYAYEDFVHGYRPVLTDQGQPSFELTPGPLLRLARRAELQPNRTFILLVDEINRGNVAKVFGELYFLLEYRRERITLQYRQEPFSLPENLWIIGTMNTADRSIALVDAALRRRFHFVPFYPNRPPIEGLLSRWLAANAPDHLWVAEAVDAVNALLPDPNLGIGPSHFIRSNLDDRWIDLIWTHSILPYLEEQYLDDPDALQQFDLVKLRKKVQKVTPNPASPDEPPSDVVPEGSEPQSHDE